MAGHTLYGMVPCFGHTGVTFDVKNDRPGPGSLRGHFEAARGYFLRLKGVTFDVKNDRPGPGSLRGHFEAARGYFLRLKALLVAKRPAALRRS